MNINLHNYEEYFILYADNELSAEGRKAVEEFVDRNPDLKSELDTLYQFKLVPDTELVYPAKEELLKGLGQADINTVNYPSWLLLYIDEELSAEERKMVEVFAEKNEVAKRELELLKRTKLQAPSVSFAGKSSLYRHETRRIPLLFRRMAAAVLLIALGLAAIYLFTKPSGRTPGLAKQNKEIRNIPVNKNSRENRDQKFDESTNPNRDENPVVAVNPKARTIEKDPIPFNSQKEKNNTGIVKTSQPVQKSPMENSPVTLKKEEVIATNDRQLSNNLPQPEKNLNPSNDHLRDAVAVSNLPRNPEAEIRKPVDPIVTSPTDKPSDIIPAAYKADQNFGADETDGKKNKHRGLFRTIARTFEKRTHIDPTTDDNKLLVAGWSINLK